MGSRLLASLILMTTVFALAVPAAAEGQRRIRRPGARSVIVAGAGWGAPGFWFYDPVWYGYPYRPYGYRAYWSPYQRGYPPRFEPYSVAVRLDAEPVEAEVYVDGHLAGEVDDFDGLFQRLRLRPGEHEIALYLEGYQTIRERRYFNPNSSHTIRLTMQPLAPGDPAEPRPVPAVPAQPPDRRDPPRTSPAPQRPIDQPGQFGTLSLRVQPADAEILIDGKPWPGDASKMPVSIPLETGRRKIEVRKDGYEPYVQDVLIRRGRTLTLNVALTKL